MSKTETGALAEKLAAKALKKRGYKILEKNLKMRMGEIDILALHKKVLVIVEVKSSTGSSQFGPPFLHVDQKKQRKLKKLALSLIQEIKLTATDIRFDVVSVEFEENGPKVEIIENAFT